MKMLAPLEIGLGVRDLARMRSFYEEALDCRFISEVAVPADKARAAALAAEGYVVVRLQTRSGERIKLLAAPNPAPPQAVPEFILAQPNAAYLTFIVDDIGVVMEKLQRHGAHFLTGPRAVEVRPGTWLAFCRDPEGHLVEIVQYDDIASYRTDLNHRSI